MKFKYNVNDHVTAVLGGRQFPGVITHVGKNYTKVLPDEGKYFSDPQNRRELSVPLSNNSRYSISDRIIKIN